MTHACGVGNTEKYSVCKSVKLASSVCLFLGNAEIGVRETLKPFYTI